MMDKFFEWFGRNRITIGYVVGGANVGSGIVQIVSGSFWEGTAWLILGAVIILDSRMFK
jgi:hypothetical protein